MQPKMSYIAAGEPSMDAAAAERVQIAAEAYRESEDQLVRRAEELLQEYKAGKQALERRIIDNEQWFRQRHWDLAGHSKNPGDPEPASGWLFNALANKHADAMDNFPTLAVLPREAADAQDANILSDVLPVVLEQNDYEQVYSDMWWYKLRSGTGVTGVFWDSSKLNGLGDIAVKSLDLLNLFWEPGVSDIQDSPNLFYVTLHNADSMREAYPDKLSDADAGSYNGLQGVTIGDYVQDEQLDKSKKLLVIDWYHKQRVENRTVLHFRKICAGKVLFDSETDPAYAGGFYDHGKYPFVLDTLFPIPNSPAGFGYIETCKSAQVYIDKLDQALLKNTIMGARPRHWLKNDGMVNEDEYADWSKDFVHFNGNGNPQDSVQPIQIPPLNGYAATMREAKVAELKEISGNRDFSQGGTAGGVTAFSAIQALKESGSKLSRDMIASSYRAFAHVGELCIELMRQFYQEPRMFRITGSSGETRFSSFGGAQIAPKPTGDAFMTGTRVPVFDIRVIAQKSDPFNSAVQNERAQTLYQMGFFNPQMADQALMALEMMDFEGIDRIKSKISENGMLSQRIQQMTQLALAMAQKIDDADGTDYAAQIAAIAQGGNPA